jgi:hypothetical protein
LKSQYFHGISLFKGDFMTTEAFGGELSQAEQHTRQLAMERADRAAESIREIIGNHEDLLGADLIEVIVQREYDKAYQEALDKRQRGELNDNCSLGAGLTVYMTSRGQEVLTRVSEEHGLPHADMLKAVEDKPGCFSLRLDEGVYSTGWGAVELYDKGEVDDASGVLSGEGIPISLGYTFIVRIEGDHGELWQNWSYNADGTVKHEQV